VNLAKVEAAGREQLNRRSIREGSLGSLPLKVLLFVIVYIVDYNFFFSNLEKYMLSKIIK